MKNIRKKIGSYEPLKMSKEEIKNFQENKNIWWDVYLGGSTGYFVKTQFEAEVISRLERVERLLKKLKGRKEKPGYWLRGIFPLNNLLNLIRLSYFCSNQELCNKSI